MADEQIKLWQMWDKLIFTKLIRSFKMAIRPTKMTIAMSAVCLICLIGWIMDVCTIAAPEKKPILESTVSTIATFGYEDKSQIYITDPASAMDSLEEYFVDRQQGVFSTLWNFSVARFNGATVSLIGRDVLSFFTNVWGFFIGLTWAIKYHTVYSIVLFALTVPITCIAGGAISRSASLEFARGEKVGLGQAVRFATKNFLSFLTAPSVCIGIMLFLGLFVYLLGLIGNIPWVGELIIAIGLGVALIFGLMTVLMLIGTTAGAGLMFPAIAYEGSDGYDAISRSFSYVFNQPWRMILYTAVVTIHGTIAYLFVRFFVYLLLIVTYTFLNLGIFNNPEGPDKLTMIWSKPEFFDLLATTSAGTPMELNLPQQVSGFFIHLIVIFVVGLIVAFIVSFYCCASTIIYSLIRANVDNVPIDHIYAPLDRIRNSVENDRHH